MARLAGGRTMNHDIAEQTQMTERYLLGELSTPEREEFEEHFFEGAECAEAVKLGAIFADNARAVSEKQNHAPAEAQDLPGTRSGRRWIRGLRAGLSPSVP